MKLKKILARVGIVLGVTLVGVVGYNMVKYEHLINTLENDNIRVLTELTENSLGEFDPYIQATTVSENKTFLGRFGFTTYLQIEIDGNPYVVTMKSEGKGNPIDGYRIDETVLERESKNYGLAIEDIYYNAKSLRNLKDIRRNFDN